MQKQEVSEIDVDALTHCSMCATTRTLSGSVVEVNIVYGVSDCRGILYSQL